MMGLGDNERVFLGGHELCDEDMGVRTREWREIDSKNCPPTTDVGGRKTLIHRLNDTLHTDCTLAQGTWSGTVSQRTSFLITTYAFNDDEGKIPRREGGKSLVSSSHFTYIADS